MQVLKRHEAAAKLSREQLLDHLTLHECKEKNREEVEERRTTVVDRSKTVLEKYETLIKEVHESKVDLGYAPPSESTANEAASSVLALDDGTLPRKRRRGRGRGRFRFTGEQSSSSSAAEAAPGVGRTDGRSADQRATMARPETSGCSFVKFWNKIHEDCQSQSPETKTFMGNNAVVCDHAAKCVSGNPRNPRTPMYAHVRSA